MVGVDIDYEVLGADNGMLMVTASGTAVQIAQRPESIEHSLGPDSSIEPGFVGYRDALH